MIRREADDAVRAMCRAALADLTQLAAAVLRTHLTSLDGSAT